MALEKPIIILIAGGHAAGKRTFACLLKDAIESNIVKKKLEIEVVSLKDFESKEKGSNQLGAEKYNSIFDTAEVSLELRPSRFMFDDLCRYLNIQSSKDSVRKIFIVHGLYSLYDKTLRSMAQLKIFINTDADDRLIRWIRRDILEGYKQSTLQDVTEEYIHKARIEMSLFIFPTKEFADLVLQRISDEVVLELIVDGLIPLLGYNTVISENDAAMYENYLRPRVEGFLSTDSLDLNKNVYYELN